MARHLNMKFRWELDQIENVIIVTRVVETGEVDESQQSILKLSRVGRDSPFDALNEIRASLDMLEKQFKADEEAAKTSKK